MTDFCVYEHWRPDRGRCFYVGKGKLKRARYLRRKENNYHGRVVAALERKGLRPEIRIVASDLSEAEAFRIEIEQIALWRSLGVELVNRTIGGEGAAGFVHTPEFCALQSKLHEGKPKPWLRGRKLRPEHRAKIGASQKGRPRREDTKAKISATQKGRSRPHPPGWRISEAALERLRNRVFTEEHRRKISVAQKLRIATRKQAADAAA